MNEKINAKGKSQTGQFESGMEPQCITSIQNNWFVGAKIIMDQIFDCMRQKEKARIVFDYDPQGGKTKITSYCCPRGKRKTEEG